MDLINRSRAAISFEKFESTPVVLAVSIQGIRTQASKDQRADLARDQTQPAKLLGELIEVAKKSRAYKQFLLNRPANIPFWTEGAEYLTQKWIEKITLEMPKSLEGFSATQIKDRMRKLLAQKLGLDELGNMEATVQTLYFEEGIPDAEVETKTTSLLLQIRSLSVTQLVREEVQRLLDEGRPHSS